MRGGAFCCALGLLARAATACDVDAYYSSVDLSLTGAALRAALRARIAAHDVIPYTSTATDVWDALKVVDADPDAAGHARGRVENLRRRRGVVATPRSGRDDAAG